MYLFFKSRASLLDWSRVKLSEFLKSHFRTPNQRFLNWHLHNLHQIAWFTLFVRIQLVGLTADVPVPIRLGSTISHFERKGLHPVPWMKFRVQELLLRCRDQLLFDSISPGHELLLLDLLYVILEFLLVDKVL